MRNPPTEVLKPSMLRAYQTPSLGTAVWQTASAFGLYIACIAAMYAALHVSVWLTLALAVPASGLIVRIFMLQHDCGHNSLFPSRRLNKIVGTACSLVTLTPFAYWRRLHARHHKSWNDLDNRGIPADFFSDCLTLTEYKALRPSAKFLYRVSRHPALIHLLLPPVVFILLYRVPFDTPASFRRERRSVYLLNIALAGMFALLIALFGIRSVALVHLPAMAIAAITGIWLFAVQHRFEGAQWSREKDWNFKQASLHGTSYLKLPLVMRWFSANIGLHHIHHLRPGIPNYYLQACQDGLVEEMKSVTVLTLRDAFKAPSYALWDEALSRMVPFPP
ncbi:MAG: fatty acid desaturase [Acidocella sp.]|nr:fatty acid desaturase [Acidocella sp.]